MKTIRQIDKVKRQTEKAKLEGRSIGFVPTMGFLHEGHLCLIREARKNCDYTAVSIFVNPTQFAPSEDFRSYPRDMNRDARLCRKEKVDLLFVPDEHQMYPEDFQTHVEVEELTQGLCGAKRPGHFRAVTTVVTKLFNIVCPDVAYFGQKDAQQARVIEKMVEDLNMNIKVKILPIAREKDGLALSSRNIYLTREQRKQAPFLYKSLLTAEKLIDSGNKDVSEIKKEIKKEIRQNTSAKIDYVEIVNWNDLKEADRIKGKILIAAAAWFGKARLIDNIIIEVD